MKALNLNMKALYFCIALICIAIANFLYQVHSINANQTQTLLSSTTNEVLNDITHLQSQAGAYVTNAPRDYESYYRDVALYHKQFKQAVANLEQHNQVLKETFATTRDDPILQNLFKDDYQHFVQAFNALTASIDTFAEDYHEQIGEDEKEPRLEWAAQSIQEFGPKMEQEAGYFSNQMDQWQHTQAMLNKNLGYGIAIALFASALFFSVWFMTSVVMRIRRTAVACDRVANGDFGFQIPARNSDEISQMIHSFNSVSERFKLVLSLLDQLNDSISQQQAVDAIMAICSEYFTIHWSGLVLVEPDESIRLVAANPVNSMKRWSAKSARIKGNNLAGILQEHVQHHKPWLIEDLEKFSLATSDSRFLRELIRNTHATTLFGIPLNAVGSNQQGMLLLASRERSLIEGKRGELLFKLSPLIASRLIGSQTATNEPDKHAA